MSDRAPVFIVGTGRCGSTMLSNMLRQHPRLLSVSEFFSLVTDLGGRIAATFPEGPITAAELLDVIAAPHPKSALMHRHGVVMDEVLYRPGGPASGARFTTATGVPPILETTLPHLSDQPEALFDELCEHLSRRPPALSGDHYRALFGWLCGRLGKRGWVERSGGSLRIVRRLAAAFPDARFVHLVRDGRSCAVSMSRHLGFRMVFVALQLTEILGVDPFESPDRTWEADLPDDLCELLPERFDGARFRAYQTPVALCGHYWSGEIMAGLGELGQLPRARVLTLRYEDFLAAPVDALWRLQRFLEPEGGDGAEAWVSWAAQTVRGARSQWQDLAEPVRGELEEACRPGFDALGTAPAE